MARDGGRRLIAWTNTALLDDSGHPQHIIATVIDVTEHRQTEARLQRTEGRYRDVLDGVRAVVFDTDARGRWTYLNPAWTDLTGYRVPESLGHDSATFVHPDDRGIVPERVAAALAEGSQELRCEHRYVTSDGDVRWAELNARLALQGGRVTGVRGTMTDVTLRREAEEELRQQHRSLTPSWRPSTRGSWPATSTGSLRWPNRATREMHGLTEVAGSPEEWSRHFNLYHADGRTPLAKEEVPLLRALNGERVRGLEMVIAPVDLPRRTLVTHAQPIHDLDGRHLGAVVAMHDITDRKQLERDLRSISEISRLVAVNADAREAVVQSSRELTGAAFSVLYEPDDHDMLLPTVIVGMDAGTLSPVPVGAERSGAAHAIARVSRFSRQPQHATPASFPELVQRTGALSLLFEPAHLGDEASACWSSAGEPT